MKFVKHSILIYFLSISQSFSGETLDVAVIFDSDTTQSLSSYAMRIKADTIIKALNKSFEKSNLLSTINFRRAYYNRLPVLKNNGGGSYSYDFLKASYNYYQSYDNGVKTSHDTLHLVQKINNIDLVIAVVKPNDYILIKNYASYYNKRGDWYTYG